MKRKAGVILVVAMVVLVSGLAGCGSSAKAPNVNLSDYMDLKSGEAVFITSDGTATPYGNTINYGVMSECGLQDLEDYLLDTKRSNTPKFAEIMKDSVVVCKGDVTAIIKKDSKYAVFISYAYETTTLGNTFTPEPKIAIEMTESQIKELGIDLRSELLAAGYLDTDLHEGSLRYAALDGPTNYQGGLMVLKSPVMGQVVENVGVR